MRWSISWADIMMTMFILFVVLYLYKAHEKTLTPGHADVEPPAAFRGTDLVEQPVPQSVPHPYAAVTGEAMTAGLASGSPIHLADDPAVRIALPGDLLFDLGKADIRPEAEQQLKKIGALLKSTPYVVNVAGHTDNLPSRSVQYPSNWELSAARASRVARFLIDVSGVPEDRFFVSGHAWLMPLRPNTTAYNRSLNRRVEIILMKEMPAADPHAGIYALDK